MSFPTYESCQPGDGVEPNPEQIFQWFLTALPFAGATPFIIQPELRGEWSQYFWDLGLRHHPELQTKRIVPPIRGQRNSMNAAVAVVGVDDPDPSPEVIQDPATLTREAQELQLNEYRKLGRLPEVRPSVEGAEVLAGPLFDPAEHSPSTVNGYLMAASEFERRRVVAAEMVGKKRDQVLRKWKGV